MDDEKLKELFSKYGKNGEMAAGECCYWPAS